MGDARRFDVFADFILKHARRGDHVADIAGGKQGKLQDALRRRGFKAVTTIDPRRRQIDNHNARAIRSLFTPSIADPFDLLVGMHPDDATDMIIVEAARRRVPFIVVPCCVRPNAIPYHGGGWQEHLMRVAKGFGFRVERVALPMTGANKVIIGRPK